MKHLHAASRTSSKCQSADAKAKQFNKFKKDKGESNDAAGARSKQEQEENQLQEDMSKLEAGSAGRHASCRFEAILSSQTATFGLLALGPFPPVRAIVFWPCDKVL